METCKGRTLWAALVPRETGRNQGECLGQPGQGPGEGLGHQTPCVHSRDRVANGQRDPPGHCHVCASTQIGVTLSSCGHSTPQVPSAPQHVAWGHVTSGLASTEYSLCPGCAGHQSLDPPPVLTRMGNPCPPRARPPGDMLGPPDCAGRKEEASARPQTGSLRRTERLLWAGREQLSKGRWDPRAAW